MSDHFADGFVDDRDGHYYVSVVDGRRYALALGPFVRHADALAAVAPVRDWCYARNDAAWFWSFGTCRLNDDAEVRVGKLNDRPELAAHLEPAELAA